MINFVGRWRAPNSSERPGKLITDRTGAFAAGNRDRSGPLSLMRDADGG